MGKLVVSEFITLDGVMEAPGGEPTHPHSGWVFDFMGPQQEQYKLAEVQEADAHLLGRVTYESFAGAWPERQGPFAEKINSMPKYVVSSTLSEPLEWENSSLLRGEVSESVGELKQRHDGPLLVAGSATLVHSLFEVGLGRRAAADGLPGDRRRRHAALPGVAPRGRRSGSPTAAASTRGRRPHLRAGLSRGRTGPEPLRVRDEDRGDDRRGGGTRGSRDRGTGCGGQGTTAHRPLDQARGRLRRRQRIRPKPAEPDEQPLRRARCPAGAANCRSAEGTVIYVERVDPDGDGDAISSCAATRASPRRGSA